MGSFSATDGMKVTMPMYILGMDEEFKISSIESDLDFATVSIKKSDEKSADTNIATSLPETGLINSNPAFKDVDNIIDETLKTKPEDKEKTDKPEKEKGETEINKYENQKFEITFEVKPGHPPTSKVFENAVKIQVKSNHPKMKEVQFKIGFVST